MAVNHTRIRVTPDSTIVERLFEKKRLLEAGDARHEMIRPLLIVLGGGMRGVSGGGAVTALNLMGLNQVFDMAIGASAGAPIAAYFLAGTEQTYLGTSIFYDELRGKKFIDPWNFKEIANIDWLGETFAKGTKKLDTDAVTTHRTKLYIALTDYIDGSTQLYPVKDYPDRVVDMLTISSAIPSLYRRTLCFDDRRYLDGTIAFSVRRIMESELIKDFSPTDVLLITNTEEQWVSSPKTYFIERLAHLFSHHFERLLLRRIQLIDDFDYLGSQPDINVGVIDAPPIPVQVGNLTTDEKKVYTLGNETLKYALESFGKSALYKPLREPA